jgi:hypothetical protein
MSAYLSHRAGLVKTRTELKNRIHNLLDKYDLKPERTDLFSKKSIERLRSLQLQPMDKAIPDSDLPLHFRSDIFEIEPSYAEAC